MIRIETEQNESQLTFRVAGKLCGRNVEALAECWHLVRARYETQSVDLSNVISIDQSGWCLLRRMHSAGMNIFGKGLAGQTIADELKDKEGKRL